MMVAQYLEQLDIYRQHYRVWIWDAYWGDFTFSFKYKKRTRLIRMRPDGMCDVELVLTMEEIEDIANHTKYALISAPIEDGFVMVVDSDGRWEGSY